jgi:hypothetical protein
MKNKEGKKISMIGREDLNELMPSPPSGKCQHQAPYSLHYCGRDLLKNKTTCFWHSNDKDKYEPDVIYGYFGDSKSLKDAIEDEVAKKRSLAGVYLKGARVEGDWFRRGPNMAGADLRFANLSEAHLSYGSLNGANLGGANLEASYLGDVDIRNADLSDTNMHKAKFRNNDFSGVKGLSKECFKGLKWGFIPLYRILETYPEQCEYVYRALARHFTDIHASNDASWATFRELAIHRRLLRKKLNLTRLWVESMIESSLGIRQSRRLKLSLIMRWLFVLIELILSYVSCLVFGYGEKPLRILGLSLLTILGYAFAYNNWQALSERGFDVSLYFSIVTFTTLGFGDILPKPAFRLLAGSEAILGILFIGLFLFTIGRRTGGR